MKFILLYDCFAIFIWWSKWVIYHMTNRSISLTIVKLTLLDFFHWKNAYTICQFFVWKYDDIKNKQPRRVKKSYKKYKSWIYIHTYDQKIRRNAGICRHFSEGTERRPKRNVWETNESFWNRMSNMAALGFKS